MTSPRSRLLAPALAVSLLAAWPGAAPALTLEETRCLCADGARNTGDFVSCMAHLTRRLEASGDMTAAERAEVIRASAQASLEEIGAFPGACAAPVLGWGIGLQVEQEKVAPGGSVEVEALLWNLSPDDVGAGSGSGSAAACHLRVQVLDADGFIVRRPAFFCTTVMAEFMIPSGTVTRVAVMIAAEHWQSDTGMPDGSPLPPGTYRVVIEPDLRAPNRMPLWEGLEPTANFRLVVE